MPFVEVIKQQLIKEEASRKAKVRHLSMNGPTVTMKCLQAVSPCTDSSDRAQDVAEASPEELNEVEPALSVAAQPSAAQHLHSPSEAVHLETRKAANVEAAIAAAQCVEASAEARVEARVEAAIAAAQMTQEEVQLL